MSRRVPFLAVLVATAALTACAGEEPAQEPVQEAPAAEAAAPDAAPAGGLLGAVDVGKMKAAAGTAAPAPAQAPVVAAPPAADANALWVQIDALSVREKPSPKAKKVDALSWGTKVEVLAEEGGFVKIGEGRYVARKHLTDRKAKFVPRAH